jgi:hypothetical protein
MTYAAFLTRLLENLEVYGVILVLAAVVHLLVYRKYILGFFDPFFFVFVVTYIFSSSVVVFLWYDGQITHDYGIYYLLSQLAFYAGFRLLAMPWYQARGAGPGRQASADFGALEWRELDICYLTAAILYVVAQLTVYLAIGVPAFMESRWETYSSGKGLGILERVISITRFVVIFALFARYFYARGTKRLARGSDLPVFLFMLVASILSGAKIAIIEIPFISFYASMCVARRFGWDWKDCVRHLRTMKWFVILGVPPAILISFFHVLASGQIAEAGDADVLVLLTGLLTRMVYTGDIYFLSWPEDALQQLNSHGLGFLALFRNLLEMFRVVPSAELPVDIGFQIFNYHYPQNAVLSGPGAHFDVFGLFYFGFTGGLVLSLVVGAILGWAVVSLRRLVPASWLGGLTYGVIAYNVLVFNLNPSVGLSVTMNVLFVFVPLVIVTKLVSRRPPRRPARVSTRGLAEPAQAS